VPTTPEPTNTTTEPEKTPQDRLATFVTDAGFSLDLFNKWAVPDFIPQEAATWADVPEQFATRCLKGSKGLITQLTGVAK
jgi:hypothetical protein